MTFLKKLQASVRGIRARREVRSMRSKGKMKFMSSTVDTQYNYTDKKLIVYFI
jgi:hypothetical protein